MPCLVNRRRLWTTRIILESRMHEFSSMVTLTYDQEHVPTELVPRHLQLFLKRLRKAYPSPLRFFAVGEYGDKTLRPHFHLAIFGLSCLDQEVVEKAWPLGFVHLGELNERTAAYIAGYVSKKFKKGMDVRIGDKRPEFIRMSNRPGIGKDAAKLMAKGLLSKGASKALVGNDVPHEVRVSGGKFPLGRYIRGVMRDELGWDTKTPVPVVRKLALERSTKTGADLELESRRRKVSERNAIARMGIDLSKRKLR